MPNPGRFVYDPASGADITASAQSAMLGASVLPLADLFWLQYVGPHLTTSGFPPTLVTHNLFMISGPYPIAVGKLQAAPNQPGSTSGVVTVNANYLPARISHSAFEYAVGLDTTVDVTWYTDDSLTLSDSAGTVPWGFKWALLQGYPYEPIDPVTMVVDPTNPGLQECVVYRQAQVSSGAVNPGFPHVPPPEMGI